MSEAGSAERPMLRLLTDDDIKNIHDASLTILEKTGVIIKNNEALNLLKNSGCQVDLDKKAAHIPEHLVKECLSKTRPTITLYHRDGKSHLEIGENNVVFNPGSSAVYFNDHESGEIRQPFAQDLVHLVG